MKKQPITTSEERKLKFAEAGVLFVLVLAITVFVGARMADRGVDETDALATAVTAEVAATSEETEMPVTLVAADETTIEETVTAEEPASLEVEPPRIVTYAVAEQAYLSGEYGSAVELFTSYVADHPQNAWGHYMLGLSEWKAGDADAAEASFDIALEIKPDHVKSLVNSARVLIELDRAGEARERLEAALRMAPENVDANRVYSRLAHHEGRLDDAIEGYHRVLDIAPDDAWSLNNLGLIHIEQDDFAAALAPLAKAALLRPEMACVQNNLGVALERNGYFGAAAEAYAAALDADEDYAKADESFDRVSGLTEAADLVPVDLALLADSFSRTMSSSPVEITAPDEMDVASAIGNDGIEDDPQPEAP